MKRKNICLFTPQQTAFETIHTVNFVLETNETAAKTSLSTYRINYVAQGEAVLRFNNQEFHLYRGDVFFGFPAKPYRIEPTKDFQYMYISFLGARANYLIDKFRINDKNFLFRGFKELYSIWNNAIRMDASVTNLRSESVLLYTFSSLATKYYPSQNLNKENKTANAIKQYVDKNYLSKEFSLQTTANAFSYSPKYISALFKRTFHSGVTEYVTTLRIQYACNLIQQGLTSIKNIASLCGFKDPLYFTKVFKKKTGTTPKLWIQQSFNS